MAETTVRSGMSRLAPRAYGVQLHGPATPPVHDYSSPHWINGGSLRIIAITRKLDCRHPARRLVRIGE